MKAPIVWKPQPRQAVFMARPEYERPCTEEQPEAEKVTLSSLRRCGRYISPTTRR